jgi:hypothetical protein
MLFKIIISILVVFCFIKETCQVSISNNALPNFCKESFNTSILVNRGVDPLSCATSNFNYYFKQSKKSILSTAYECCMECSSLVDCLVYDYTINKQECIEYTHANNGPYYYHIAASYLVPVPGHISGFYWFNQTSF